MEVRVEPVAGDSGWHSQKPREQGRGGRGARPPLHRTEPQDDAAQAEDYYTPSQPDEEA